MSLAARHAWVRHAFPIVVAVVAAIALGFLPPRPHGAITFLTNWEYRLSDASTELGAAWSTPGASKITLPAHPAGAGSVLWLRTRLPSTPVPDAVVAFDAVLGPFEAYVGERRVLVFPDPEGLAARGPVGLPWQLVPVGPGDAGQPLTLRISAHYRPMGVKGTPLYGPRADLISWALERDLPRLVVGLMAVLLGLLGLVSFASRATWRLPVGFWIWGTAIGVYVIHYTHLKDVVADVSLASFWGWLVALPCMGIGALLFLEELFGASPRAPFRWLLRVNLWVAAAYALALVVAFVLVHGDRTAQHGVWAFALATNLIRLLIVGSALVVLYQILRLAAAGDSDARIFLLGFGLLLAFAIRDIMAAFGAALLSWRSQVHVGALACVVAMAVLLQRRHLALHERALRLAEEAAARGREKELLLRDLHDGIGALISNIRMLADIGQKNDARARSALSTIAELSAKSLAELRAFVQTLDDESVSWERQVAELRRFGASLVEAHGRSFEMDVTLTTDGRPPTLLSLHLLRIFSEGLTNALRRANGTYVKVALTALPGELCLTMENDGDAAGLPGRGIGAGRGLANLRARASELGGALSIEVADVTRLELRVPLPSGAA